MNTFTAYTQPVPGGFRAMVRFARDGKPKPIMETEYRPKVYPTELEATKDALVHVLRYFNGIGNHEFRRAGETLQAADADSHFNLKPFIRQKGKSKRVIVERKVRA